MKINAIYEDDNLLVIEKPAQLIVFSEQAAQQETLMDELLSQFGYLEKAGQSPRYGIIHRLDKDTSGILLVAKNDKSLFFFQSE